MASTLTKRIWYEQYACEKSGPFSVIDLLGKEGREVCPTTVEAFRALDQALTMTEYKARVVGTYKCRPITSGKGLSLHSYGIAVDIDPYDYGNPYYGRLHPKGSKFSWDDTKFLPHQVEAVERIRTNDGKKVWFWGGRWITLKDYMHWEIDGPPSSLETGINWRTVAGGSDLAFLTEDQQKELARFLGNLTSAKSSVDFVFQAVEDIRTKNDAEQNHGGYATRDDIKEGSGITQEDADKRYVRRGVQETATFK